ncbi:hypothetical protein SNEBB_008562 [Seison nebaliae]|nr:hypothetical protein SNEBB_008562 [Seison nebaliae]
MKGMSIDSDDITVFKRGLTLALPGLKKLLNLEGSRRVNTDNKPNIADFYIDHMLMPNLSGAQWKGVYRVLVSYTQLDKPDEIWRPYTKLLHQLPYIQFNTLNFSDTGKFTTAVHKLTRQLMIPAKFRVTSAISQNAIDQILPNLKRGGLRYFDKKYLLIFSTHNNGIHYQLTAVDWEKNRLISFESVETKRENPKYPHVLISLLNYTASELGEHVNIPKDKRSDQMFPNVSAQKDLRSCGFYTLINAKYFAHRVLTIFRNREVQQLKKHLAIELLRNRLFPIFDEETLVN